MKKEYERRIIELEDSGYPFLIVVAVLIVAGNAALTIDELRIRPGKEYKMEMYKIIRKNEEIKALIAKGNENLGKLGFTEHSEKHCILVAERTADILKKLGYSTHEIELAKIAGFMHDNRIRNRQS